MPPEGFYRAISNAHAEPYHDVSLQGYGEILAPQTPGERRQEVFDLTRIPAEARRAMRKAEREAKREMRKAERKAEQEAKREMRKAERDMKRELRRLQRRL